MPIIYLRHPVHGSKVATMEMEAVYDEKLGWTRYEPGVEAPPPDPAANVLVTILGKPEPAPEVIDPPHHPLDHDGDGKPGGSLPGPRRRRRAPQE